LRLGNLRLGQLHLAEHRAEISIGDMPPIPPQMYFMARR
jgi:hypothetical protein